MSNSTTPAVSSPASLPPASSASAEASISQSIVASVSSAILESISSAQQVSSAPPPPPPVSTPAPAPASSFVATSVVTGSPAPPTTVLITSVVTPSGNNQQSQAPVTVVVTAVRTNPAVTAPVTQSTSTTSATSTSSSAVPLGGSSGTQNKGKDGGLSAGGKTAIAVVIPVVVVGLLVVLGLFLWRRRKQRKNAEEARRMEVEEYGFNPNHDPTLPPAGAVGSPEMAEDTSGYRGWGNTTTTSGRNPSTTISGGAGYAAVSDSGSNPGGYHSPGSPTQGTASDGHSGDPLVNRRETMDSETVAALGAGPVAGAAVGAGVQRGISNASSHYSAAGRSDISDPAPLPNNGMSPHDYYTDNTYYQPGPYGDGTYGGGQGTEPVIQDVQARRNTRIENPSVFPQQGNAGIAQNF